MNTASRMEKYGEPGRVHLSAVTRSLLSDTFHFETRGGVLDIVDDIAQHISQAVATDGGLVRNSAAPRENAREVSRELVALSTFLRQDMAVSSRAASCRSLKKAVDFDPQNPEARFALHCRHSLDRTELPEIDQSLRSVARGMTIKRSCWVTIRGISLYLKDTADRGEACRKLY